MNRYNIRKIFIWPAFKFGAVIGAALMILPGIAWGIITRSTVRAMNAFLGSPGLLAGSNPDLTALASQIAALDRMGPMVVVWTALAAIIIGGLLYGLAAAISALLYNLVASLSGGLLIGAEVVAAPVVQPQPALPQPQALPPAQPQAAAIPPSPGAPAVAPGAPVGKAQPQAGPWLAVGVPPQHRPLRPDRTRLGSAADNDIVVQGANPYHAEIRFEDGVYVLYDMAAGQTWVNNRLVAGRNMLKEGFVIRLAAQEMVFHVS